MKKIPFFTFIILSSCSVAYAEMQPKDVADSDLWVEIYWCGKLIEFIEDGDKYILIYKSIPIKDSNNLSVECSFKNKSLFKNMTTDYFMHKELKAWGINQFIKLRKRGAKCITAAKTQVIGFYDYRGKEIPEIKKNYTVNLSCQSGLNVY